MERDRHHRFVALLLGLFGCLIAAVAAQQSSPPKSPSKPAPAAQEPTFHGGIDLIQVDVSVLDKNRQPVHDLTGRDFTVFEDGKPQRVVTFTPIDVPDPEPESATTVGRWMRDVAPDVRTNAFADRPENRLFVLLIDDALIPADPGILANARQIAKSAIMKLGPADRMAVLFTQGSGAAQDFTNDRAKLLAAADKLQAGHAGYFMGWDTAMPHSLVDFFKSAGALVATGPVLDNDIGEREASMQTLRSVADALVSAPQRRKTLIFISPGVPVDFDVIHPQLASGTGKRMPEREANIHFADEMKVIFRDMQRANVNAYPIDPGGLAGLENFVNRQLSTLDSLRGPGQPIDPTKDPYDQPPPQPFDLAHRTAQQDLDFLEATAANTGGFAIINTNDFEPGLNQIFRENGSYYLLGYQAPPTNAPGSMHRLTVKVDRPGVEVRTRSAYYAAEPEKTDKNHDPPSPLAVAVSGLLPNPDMPMQVALAPVALPGRAEAAVTIVLDLRRSASPQPIVELVDLQTSAFTEDGVACGGQHQNARVVLAAGDPSQVIAYEALSHIDLKPGRYQLRLAAHSSSSEMTGSVYADVDIPDFAKEPLSLSGVMLEATPPLPASPKDTLAGIVPIIPTAERVFSRTDHVSAFVRAYQGGAAPLAPVTLSIRIVDRHDIVVLDRLDTLGADGFAAARSSDDHVGLPLDQIQPGAYLMTIIASLGKTQVRRDVRFSVR